MKTSNILAVAVATILIASCTTSQNAPIKTLETELDSVSYAVGMSMAAQIKSNFSDIEQDYFFQGFRNGMDSTNLAIEFKDINTVLSPFFQERQQAAAAEKAQAQFGDVKKASEAFLAANAKKKGVVTTASGLQYKVLTKGSGASPVATDKITFHYHGTTIDGTVFDSSIDRKKSVTYGVNQLIKGWVEGLQLMQVGAKYMFYVPQELAYGATPPGGGVIKPFMALVFEVELIAIK